jgi:hypothetical protein
MIPTCPSYSCLLTLEEKPNGLTTYALSSHATPIEQPIGTCQQPYMSLDDAQFRYSSPLTVVFCDDHDMQESTVEDNDCPTVSLFMCPSFQEALKMESGHQRARNCRIRFHPTVDVTLIPSHRDYSEATKELLWASREEIRVNAVKAQMEMCLFEHRYAAFGSDCDHNNIDQELERRFVPLSRLQGAR